MKTLSHDHFSGERALFKQRDLEIEDCLFDDGESPLKEGKNLSCFRDTFDWKYPLWYGENLSVRDSLFTEHARAGVWYSKNVRFSSLRYEAPKGFRKCENLQIENVDFPHAQETLWWNENVRAKNVQAQEGDYFCQGSRNVTIENLDLVGNYAFDHNENLHISRSHLQTKDAFWNCKKVLVEDSTIEGEYFGWNSEDVTLVRCHVKSLQGFCYMKKVRLVECVVEADRCFEYCSEIDADIHSRLVSIKNPISGRIACQGYDELILDDPDIDPRQTEIIVHA